MINRKKTQQKQNNFDIITIYKVLSVQTLHLACLVSVYDTLTDIHIGILQLISIQL